MRAARYLWATVALGTLLAPAGLTVAQSSTSYRLDEHAFNAGGHPQAGTVLGSASYLISLDALGDGVAGAAPASTSYSVDGGFIAAYPPPGEVLNLAFTDHDTLQWDAERSAGIYNLYRGSYGSLPGGSAGSCEQQEIVGTSTIDSDLPAAGNGWFYLVTVENRLDEEGTRGVDSAGTHRPDTGICP